MKTPIFLVLALTVVVSSHAMAASGMKNCAELIRSNEEIFPYFPIDKDGQLNKVALNKLVAEKKVKYSRTSDTSSMSREVITADNGIMHVQLFIDRESGRITQISSTRSWQDAPDFSGSLSNSLKFRYQGDTCIPESENFSSTDSDGKHDSGEVFNAKTCRAFVEFFRKHPGAKSCADDRIVKDLQRLVRQSAPTADSRTIDQGELWYNALETYSSCKKTPGLSAAIQDDTLWSDSPAKGGKATGAAVSQ